MTKKLRLVCVITSIALLVSVLAGTGAYVIVNHINSKALSGSYTSIGNLLKDGNTVSYDKYQALLSALGNDTTSTRNKSSINSGNAVVFQMGEINSKPIYWEVVYQAGDIITVWMTECYTLSVHNTTTPFVKYPNATIRTNVQNIYNTQKTSFGVLDKITVSPNDTTKMPQAYIDAQAVDGNYVYDCNTGDNTLANVDDKYWLVSNYEAFSLWGLSDTDRGFATTTLDGSSVSYCWLRSGSL